MHIMPINTANPNLKEALIMLARKTLFIGRFLLVVAMLGLICAPATFAAKGHKLDLNTATVEQLKELPKIGDKTAKAIVKYREDHGGFKSVDELLNVKGIGKKKLELLRPWVTVVKNDGE